MNNKYPPPKAIFVDVEKTLFMRGVVNTDLIDWLRAQDGYEIVVWSSRGSVYAQQATETAGIADIVTASISKPGYLIDDLGWHWARYTKILPVNPTDPMSGH